MKRLIVAVMVFAQGCATVSEATRARLKQESAVVFVRAPTPMVPTNLAQPEATALAEFALVAVGAGFAMLGGVGSLFGGRVNDPGTPVNVTDRFGGDDPANLLLLATRSEWKALGYAAPTIAPGVQVRFENLPQRWPVEAKVPSAPYLLHAQVDLIKVDARGFPERLDASLTLFASERAEVHTTCVVRPRDVEPHRTAAETWVALVRSCAQTLLAPWR